MSGDQSTCRNDGEGPRGTSITAWGSSVSAVQCSVVEIERQ